MRSTRRAGSDWSATCWPFGSCSPRRSGSWRAPAPISVAPPLLPRVIRPGRHLARSIGAVFSLLYTLMALSLWVLNRMPAAGGASPQARRPSADRLLPRVAVLCLQPDESSAGAAGQYRDPRDCGFRGLAVVALLDHRGWHRRSVALSITIATASILDGARRYGWYRRRRPTPSTR